jgi:hypothetical protein
LDWAALGSEELLSAILAQGGLQPPQPPWIRQWSQGWIDIHARKAPFVSDHEG